jgi:hypothetical protein
MPDQFCELQDVRMMECATEGDLVRSGQDAIDLISEAHRHQAALVVIPAERLSDDFFRLKTGVAGEIVQKVVTYGVRLAIRGDLSRYLNKSSSFRDFVRESNKGTALCFVTNADELRQRCVNRS